MKLSTSKETFFPADLHVHTPASFKCYKGPKTNEEYLEIIKRYIEKKISIIAVTDHNTILGYKTLINIKEDMQNKLKVLEEYASTLGGASNEIERLREKCNLFEEILILPGIEFEAYPGIHLLLIFNPTVKIETIESFLESAGYPPEVQGQENAESSLSLKVVEVMEKATGLGAIVIGAHVDSNKGIYHDMDGQYRIDIFKNNHLYGIQYTNPKSLGRIKETLRSPDYCREKPLAFLQCSDYHGEEGGRPIGSGLTFLKMEEKNFEGVFKALSNSAEYVSPMAPPEDLSAIKEIVERYSTIAIENIENDNKIEVRKAMSAILNMGKGAIVIGVAPGKEKSYIGIDADKDEEVIASLKEISESLVPNFGYAYLDIKKFAYGGERLIYSIEPDNRMKTIFFCDKEDKAYMHYKGAVKLATPREIAAISQKRLLARMEEHQKINERKFDSLIKDFKLIGDSIRQFMVINKIEERSTKLCELADLDYVEYTKETLEMDSYNTFGDSTGNIVYIEDEVGPRLEEAYLRCTPPRFSANIESLKIKKFKGSAIIVAPGGACYYMESDDEWTIISKSRKLTWVLTLDEEIHTEISMYSILAWLKSSLGIWYSNYALGNIDLSDFFILQNINLPFTDKFRQGRGVEKFVKDIIKNENEFLDLIKSTEEEALLKTDEEMEPIYQKFTDDHNSKIAQIAFKIDSIIEDDLKLTDEEKRMIKDFFDFMCLFNLYTIECALPDIKMAETNDIQKAVS